MSIQDFGNLSQELHVGRSPDVGASRFALSELAEDYSFFNHGALFTYAEFEDPAGDPVNDWYAEQPAGTVLIKQPFDKPLFEGIDAPCYDGRLTWNNVICAVPTPFWETLFPFLGGVAAFSQKTRAFYLTFSGEVEILDPVLVERHSVLHPGIPKIKVTVFCVDSNHARWEVCQPRAPLGPPRIVKTRPQEKMVEVAKKIFTGEFDAIAGRENPAFRKFLDKYQRVQREGPTIINPFDET